MPPESAFIFSVGLVVVAVILTSGLRRVAEALRPPPAQSSQAIDRALPIAPTPREPVENNLTTSLTYPATPQFLFEEKLGNNQVRPWIAIPSRTPDGQASWKLVFFDDGSPYESCMDGQPHSWNHWYQWRYPDAKKQSDA